MTLDIKSLSRQYEIRLIQDTDVPVVYELCRRNTLYYQYCPPFVTEDSIRRDMTALPPKKEKTDKYYVGCFDKRRLIGVIDLIMGYPDNQTAFIGFFMTDIAIQGKGVGSAIIADLCASLSEIGILYVRLGWVKGNPQAEHFWHKNGFTETGITYETNGYTVTVAQRAI